MVNGMFADTCNPILARKRTPDFWTRGSLNQLSSGLTIWQPVRGLHVTGHGKIRPDEEKFLDLLLVDETTPCPDNLHARQPIASN